MKALPNVLYITDDMTIFESETELRALVATKKTPDFRDDQVDKVNRVIWIVVPEKTSVV